MMHDVQGPNVIADFWEWYERRQRKGRSPIARYALDRCDETFRRGEWERFGYWFTIYRNHKPAVSKHPSNSK
jgi:hypothetical protein